MMPGNCDNRSYFLRGRILAEREYRRPASMPRIRSIIGTFAMSQPFMGVAPLDLYHSVRAYLEAAGDDVQIKMNENYASFAV
jgi:hypothetical protein